MTTALPTNFKPRLARSAKFRCSPPTATKFLSGLFLLATFCRESSMSATHGGTMRWAEMGLSVPGHRTSRDHSRFPMTGRTGITTIFRSILPPLELFRRRQTCLQTEMLLLMVRLDGNRHFRRDLPRRDSRNSSKNDSVFNLNEISVGE